MFSCFWRYSSRSLQPTADDFVSLHKRCTSCIDTKLKLEKVDTTTRQVTTIEIRRAMHFTSSMLFWGMLSALASISVADARECPKFYCLAPEVSMSSIFNKRILTTLCSVSIFLYFHYHILSLSAGLLVSRLPR